MDVDFHNFFAVQIHTKISAKDKCPEFFIDWISGQTLGYHNDEDDDEFRIEIDQVVVGSAGAPRHFPGFLSRVTHDPRRTLFNPFKPLDIPCRLVRHVTLTWQFDVNWYVNGWKNLTDLMSSSKIAWYNMSLQKMGLPNVFTVINTTFYHTWRFYPFAVIGNLSRKPRQRYYNNKLLWILLIESKFCHLSETWVLLKVAYYSSHFSRGFFFIIRCFSKRNR